MPKEIDIDIDIYICMSLKKVVKTIFLAPGCFTFQTQMVRMVLEM